VADGDQIKEVKELDKRIDFGQTAADYGRHRAGFPEEFFERLLAMGVVVGGRRALDLGTGTGTVARGLARRGMLVTALDRSAALLTEAARLDQEEGLSIQYLHASAEETGLPPTSFELVTAGQCWHWFDRRRAAVEARRVLISGREDRSRTLRLDPATRQHGGSDGEADRRAQSQVEAWRRDGYPSTLAQWPRGGRIQRPRDVLIRPQGILYARSVARPDSCECGRRGECLGGESCGVRYETRPAAPRALPSSTDGGATSGVGSDRHLRMIPSEVARVTRVRGEFPRASQVASESHRLGVLRCYTLTCDAIRYSLSF